MGHHRQDVVDRAVAVLDRHGLGDLTMRRLAAELQVRPSALYHHFPDKQTLLAAVADEILARGPRPPRTGSWEDRVTGTCLALREALLARTDAAEVVATARAYRLGAQAPYDDLRGALTAAGPDEELADTAARTLLHFVLGHVTEEQTHLQAVAAGALPGDVTLRDDFEAGLRLVLDGIGAALRTGRPQPR